MALAVGGPGGPAGRAPRSQRAGRGLAGARSAGRRRRAPGGLPPHARHQRRREHHVLALAALVAGLRGRGRGPVVGHPAAARRARPRWSVGPDVCCLGSVAASWSSPSLYLPPARVLRGVRRRPERLRAPSCSRGYFPWRDFMFIHGALRGRAAQLDRLRPLRALACGGPRPPLRDDLRAGVWVLLYRLAVWASPRGSTAVPGRGRGARRRRSASAVSARWFVTGAGVHPAGRGGAPATWPWTAPLTALLFVEAVLAPEAAFQVAACLGSCSATSPAGPPASPGGGRSGRPGLRRDRGGPERALLAFLALVGASTSSSATTCTSAPATWSRAPCRSTRRAPAFDCRAGRPGGGRRRHRPRRCSGGCTATR